MLRWQHAQFTLPFSANTSTTTSTLATWSYLIDSPLSCQVPMRVLNHINRGPSRRLCCHCHRQLVHGPTCDSAIVSNRASSGLVYGVSDRRVHTARVPSLSISRNTTEGNFGSLGLLHLPLLPAPVLRAPVQRMPPVVSLQPADAIVGVGHR
jgi:hypothetical protein